MTNDSGPDMHVNYRLLNDLGDVFIAMAKYLPEDIDEYEDLLNNMDSWWQGRHADEFRATYTVLVARSRRMQQALIQPAKPVMISVRSMLLPNRKHAIAFR